MQDREEINFTRERNKQAVILLLSLVTSIAAGLVPSWTKIAFTIPEQTLVSFLTFIALMMLDLLWIASKIASAQDARRELWQIEDEGDRYLLAIRSAFSRIAKYSFGKTDVFVDHLLYEMENLAVVASDAANKNTLRVSGHHFTRSEFLLDAFAASERVLRYTWRIDPSARLFDDLHWRKHFELTSSLAISHEIEIRALLLVERRDHIDAPHVQKLLEFFATHDGLDAKFALRAEYETLAADNSIPGTCIDFGIYGDRLLYQAEHYAPSSVGSWSKDATVIQRFRRFYDTLWNTQTITSNNPVSPSRKVSLAQLMAADEVVGID